jgi:cellulose synthase/poly-beta-1,6-N-acetylglucosamine synthase-like glycosyltransferase
MVEKGISISICVPSFNEERFLKAAVEDLVMTLSPAVQRLEVIIVDDGSTDSTPQLAEQLARTYSQVKVIHHQRNSGIGVCYRDALAMARGEYFTWFPGDHENSAKQFIQCLPYLRDRTIATCHHQRQDPRLAMRRYLSRSYTWILNKYFHLNLKYYNGLTIFPVSLLRSSPLVADGFALAAESLIRAIQSGYQVVELPAPLKNLPRGDSKALSFISIIRMVRDVFCIIIHRNHRDRKGFTK